MGMPAQPTGVVPVSSLGGPLVDVGSLSGDISAKRQNQNTTTITISSDSDSEAETAPPIKKQKTNFTPTSPTDTCTQHLTKPSLLFPHLRSNIDGVLDIDFNIHDTHKPDNLAVVEPQADPTADPHVDPPTGLQVEPQTGSPITSETIISATPHTTASSTTT